MALPRVIYSHSTTNLSSSKTDPQHLGHLFLGLQELPEFVCVVNSFSLTDVQKIMHHSLNVGSSVGGRQGTETLEFSPKCLGRTQPPPKPLSLKKHLLFTMWMG